MHQTELYLWFCWFIEKRRKLDEHYIHIYNSLSLHAFVFFFSSPGRSWKQQKLLFKMLDCLIFISIKKTNSSLVKNFNGPNPVRRVKMITVTLRMERHFYAKIFRRQICLWMFFSLWIMPATLPTFKVRIWMKLFNLFSCLKTHQ